MVWDLKRELGRKAIHLLSLSFLIIYILVSSTFNHKIALLILSFMLIILIELEYLRIEIGAKIPILHELWQKFRRKKEKHSLGGEVFFLIGSIICLAVFDLRIAAAAILMTTFGDMAAALIGKRFGRTWITKKLALEGILAELIVDLIIGFLIVRTSLWLLDGYPLGTPIWPIIIGMAITATLVESLVSKLDDNLLIPLFSGFAGQIILMIMIFLGLI
ncbi:MAG: SEC59/DGK1/VTE5 family protein [Candidatus Nanoarchaeia archaeon]|nr:SEC59/DGK1/VTE5 family protein [Candidatus Nanoarchaeia archaeon]MDD5588287.1 SEC59/DGK1/VTE5 family protein [Candidatus Nanoarchaeia archaeon]